jgi:hypothetical protein
MLQDFRTHVNHYAVLMAGIMLGLWALIRWRYIPQMQLWVILAMAAGYVLWGVFHHLLIKDLSVKIMLEYVLIAALFVSVFWFGVYWA